MCTWVLRHRPHKALEVGKVIDERPSRSPRTFHLPPFCASFQDELVEKLIEARSLGRADPSLIDDFNKENLERK